MIANRTQSVLLAWSLSVLAVALAGAPGRAQDSGFHLDLHANDRATAAAIGLPVYPGATIAKNEDKGKGKDDSSSADLGFSLGDFHFVLKVASYVSADSPAQVLAFYRKPLSRYGEVLECNHGKPVGALTVTRTGLTCSQKGEKGSLNVNGNDSEENHELRAGSPHQYRIVGIDESKPGPTRIGLVYLELPKDDDKSK